MSRHLGKFCDPIATQGGREGVGRGHSHRLGATYDVIAAIFIQFATPDERARLFAWFKRALTPGGILILQGYRVEQLGYRTGGPPEIDHLYTPTMVREAFADCEILELAAYDAEIHEGSGHSGMSALLGATIRRR